MALTDNKFITGWVEEQAKLCQPDSIVWIDGSESQLDALRAEAFATGELIKLNEELLPGCVYHRSALNDVARVEARTFICCEKKEDAGPTNNWMDPKEMRALLRGIYDGCMRGRTMYVIPYAMGIVGSPFAKYGIELTDSIYVVVSMAIMTRVGTNVYDAIQGDDYIKGLHSKADLDEEKRYIVHFPQDNTIMSVNSGYGGNVLLGKKCFALRIASCLGRDEGWLAEHMLILGVENPQGEVRYVCGAFPSACGKTNLAMLIRRRPIAKRDGSAGAWATTSPGCAPARTGGCGPSTRKTASSASPPAPARRPTPTPCTPR
jgi:phosphoenolpyruvate carboxykinase (GTP)